jgi:hypothetical protein
VERKVIPLRFYNKQLNAFQPNKNGIKKGERVLNSNERIPPISLTAKAVNMLGEKAL